MKYLRRVIMKLVRIITRKITRKTIALDVEIVRILRDYNVSLNKEDLVYSINENNPNVFSKFEIEYTIDRMVCDHKITTNGYIYSYSCKKIKSGPRKYKGSGGPSH